MNQVPFCLPQIKVVWKHSKFPNYFVNICLKKFYLHLTSVLMVQFFENRTTLGKRREFQQKAPTNPSGSFLISIFDLKQTRKISA